MSEIHNLVTMCCCKFVFFFLLRKKRELSLFEYVNNYIIISLMKEPYLFPCG